MELREAIKGYLDESYLMQLATVRDGKPWVCTLYFVVDNELKLYWLSLPSRQHSQDIEHEHQVAVTIAVKEDLPVIGIQAEGTASAVNDKGTVKTIMDKYTAKYDAGHDFYDNFVLNKNQHQMYCFTPSRLVLFDEVHNQGNPRQDYSPSDFGK